MKYNMQILGYSHYTYMDSLKHLIHAITIFRRRLKFELYCFFLVFLPHERNNHFRKAVAFTLILLWAVMTYGIAADWIHSTTMYGVLTAFVWSLIGRMWGIEIEEFSLTSSQKK